MEGKSTENYSLNIPSLSVLKIIGDIAREFLQSSDLEMDVIQAIKHLAVTTGAERVYIIQNVWGKTDLCMELWVDWAQTDLPAIRDSGIFSELPYETNGLQRWMDLLSQGEAIRGPVDRLPEPEKKLFTLLKTVDLLAVPVFVEWDWWGFVCLDTVTEKHVKKPGELELTQLFANMLGTALQRMEAEKELKTSKERFRTVADFTFGWEYWVDPEERLLYSSPSFTQLTGFFHVQTAEDLGFFIEIIHPDDRNNVERFLHERNVLHDFGEIEFRIINEKNQVLWISHVSRPVFGDVGEYLGQRASNRDITTQKTIEIELHRVNQEMNDNIAQLEMLNKALLLSNDMSEMLQRCFSDEDVFSVIKDYSEQFFSGCSGALYLIDKDPHQLNTVMKFGEIKLQESFEKEDCWAFRLSCLFQSDVHRSHMACKHLNLSKDKENKGLCVPLIFQDQFFGLFSLLLTTEETVETRQLVLMVANRAAATLANIRLVEKLRRQSLIDPLTGLSNRRHMTKVLNETFDLSNNCKSTFAVVMIDLDNFKQLNDCYGHRMGDEILEKVGDFLSTHIRSTDTACRYGGDEFTLILPGMSLNDVIARTQTLFSKMKNLSFTVNGEIVYQLEASIGIACYPEHGHNYDQILQAADAALYKAKERGRNQVVLAEEFPDS